MTVELVKVVGREATGLAAVMVLDTQILDLLADSIEVSLTLRFELITFSTTSQHSSVGAM